MFCNPQVIEKEWTQLHRSRVHDLISDDDEGLEDQPTDGAFVFNGTITMRKVKYSLIHKDEIPNIVAELAEDGWTVQGNVSMSPLVQGSDYFMVGMTVARAEGL